MSIRSCSAFAISHLSTAAWYSAADNASVATTRFHAASVAIAAAEAFSSSAITSFWYSSLVVGRTSPSNLNSLVKIEVWKDTLSASVKKFCKKKLSDACRASIPPAASINPCDSCIPPSVKSSISIPIIWNIISTCSYSPTSRIIVSAEPSPAAENSWMYGVTSISISAIASISAPMTPFIISAISSSDLPSKLSCENDVVQSATCVLNSSPEIPNASAASLIASPPARYASVIGSVMLSSISPVSLVEIDSPPPIPSHPESLTSSFVYPLPVTPPSVSWSIVLESSIIPVDNRSVVRSLQNPALSLGT